MEWDEVEARAKEMHPERWKPGESEANLRRWNDEAAARRREAAKNNGKGQPRDPVTGRFVKAPACRKGHPLVGWNVYHTSAGKTRCRTCHNAHARGYAREIGNPRAKAAKLGPVIGSAWERSLWQAERDERLLLRAAKGSPRRPA